MERTVERRKIPQPCDSDRICSDYFVDGESTVKTPIPRTKTRLWKKISELRREIVKYSVPKKKAEKHIADKTFQTSPPHAKIKSHILNFPLNTSTTCCQVVKNAAIVLVKTYRYRKDIEVLQKKLSIW